MVYMVYVNFCEGSTEDNTEETWLKLQKEKNENKATKTNGETFMSWWKQSNMFMLNGRCGLTNAWTWSRMKTEKQWENS